MHSTGSVVARVSMAVILTVLFTSSMPGTAIAQTPGQQTAQTGAAQAPSQTAPGPSVGSRLEGLSTPVIAAIMLALAICFGLLLVIDLWQGGTVAIESSWGGFGGGTGGWRLSPAFVYLIGLLVFGSISSVALLRPGDSGSRNAPPPAAGTPPARQAGAPVSQTGNAGGSGQTGDVPTSSPGPGAAAPTK